MSLNTLTTPYFRNKKPTYMYPHPPPPQKTPTNIHVHKYMYTLTWVMFVSFIKKMTSKHTCS